MARHHALFLMFQGIMYILCCKYVINDGEYFENKGQYPFL